MTEEKTPGIVERIAALPDGTLMKHGFFGLVALSVVMIGMDFRELVTSQAGNAVDLPALSPVRMPRPEDGNHIRPYLPTTRPIAPEEDIERFRDRPRDESEANSMRFRLGTHGAAFAEGTIAQGSAEEFAAFLAERRAEGVTEIVLHSPGGSVSDAREMALAIREAGLNTRILPDGYCASSCPLVFAGGVERIADATSWIGVHQAYALEGTFGSLDEGMEQAQIVGASAQEMLDGFGVDPLVWTRAMATPKESLYLFTPEELLELKLATDVDGVEGDA